MSDIFQTDSIPAPAPVVKMTERNNEIVILHDQGQSFRKLGNRYGLSNERVRQIYWKEKRRHYFENKENHDK